MEIKKVLESAAPFHLIETTNGNFAVVQKWHTGRIELIGYESTDEDRTRNRFWDLVDGQDVTQGDY